MLFRQIFDDQLAQYAYLVGCPETGDALLVDPERDIDRYLRVAEAEGLRVTAVAETHIHADFLSGARELAEETGAAVYLSGAGGPGAAYEWTDGYDARLLADGDTFDVGHVRVEAVHTPGHTPEHLSFLLTDRGSGDGSGDSGDGARAPMGLLSGDFVFAGDTGRPDLLETAAGQEGAMKEGAEALFGSVERFLEMDDYLQVWPGHGAGSACGKALGSVPGTTVGYERRASPAMKAAREGAGRFAAYVLEDQPEPPLYFARMKRLNREGVPLLGALPRPKALSEEDLRALAGGSSHAAGGGGGGSSNATVIDARPERADFMRGHLPGALYAPFGKSFPTLAASYADPEAPVVLIIEEENAEAAARSLVRVGLDRVDGYATPGVLAAYAEASGDALRSLPMIDAEEMDARRQRGNAQVVDVRSRSEHGRGHVPGAILAPHTRLGETARHLPREKTLLVHCGSGLRAASAASLLAARGFEVAHVNDHFSNWAGAHPDEVEKGEPVAASS